MSNETSIVQLSTMGELKERAEIFSKSPLLPTALRNKPFDVLIILQIGAELGLPPMQAIDGIHVIQGKPSISPQLGLSLAQSKLPGFFVKYNEISETKASVTMGRDRAYPDEAYTSVWDLERAKKLGVLDKDNWKKQPGTMLKWRAIGECLRTVCPDVMKGLYTDVELEDIRPNPSDKLTRVQETLSKLKPETREVEVEVTNAPQTTQEPGGDTFDDFQGVVGHDENQER